MNSKSYLVQLKKPEGWTTFGLYKGIINDRNAKTRSLFALKFWKTLIKSGKAKSLDVRVIISPYC